GRPTGVAVRHVSEWPWMLDRDDSPWYPTMRLFRQPERGDWESVFAKIERELRLLLGLDEQDTSPESALKTNPVTQVSWGELIDKMTILEIKEARLASPEAIANV